jgi:phospholipase C
MRFIRPVSGVMCLALSLGATGCGGRSDDVAPATLPFAAPPQTLQVRGHAGPRTSTVQHVVFIIQENRSFDDLWQGYPGADTQSWGYNSKGQKITLQPIGLEAPYDIDHSSYAFFDDYDGGKMDGFDKEEVYGQHGANPTYGYVPPAESKPYFDMAKQYVLADRMFTSHLDESFVSHQYAIAGQAQSSVNLPSQAWGCEGGAEDQVQTLNQDRTYGPDQQACFDYTTLGDEVTNAGLSWSFYAAATTDIWSAYQAVKHIYDGTGWSNVIAPNTKFLTDVQSGKLSNVTWITPTCTNSDHGGCEGNGGPDWVASVVNAVGTSKFWDTTTIFVMWDEWGGWYDHVPPPYVDYDGLGMRVGLLVISPYAKKRYVSHVQYEHGSVLRYIEDQFGLPQMTASDSRANSPEADCFDFTKGPRKFKPFKTKLKAADFLHEWPDRRPVDDDDAAAHDLASASN